VLNAPLEKKLAQFVATVRTVGARRARSGQTEEVT
jgi:hypothetical protein